MKGIPLHELATVRVGVEALITFQSHILLQQRSSKLDFFPGYLGMIGGHVDVGESSIEAIIREVKEESGLIIPPSECKFMFNRIVYNHDSGIIWSILGFKIELVEELMPIESEEGICKWYTLEEALNLKVLPSNLYDLQKALKNPSQMIYTYGEIKDNKYSVKS